MTEIEGFAQRSSAEINDFCADDLPKVVEDCKFKVLTWNAAHFNPELTSGRVREQAELVQPGYFIDTYCNHHNRLLQRGSATAIRYGQRNIVST